MSLKPHPTLGAFNLQQWIEEHRHLLKPPVGNQLLHHESGMIVMIVGGPNTRMDFHDDPVNEWFYQLEGDMVLKIADGSEIYDIPIRAGEVFLLPPHVRHAPQRPQEGSVGIVVESPRMMGMKDAFEWYCFECSTCVHRAEISLLDPSNLVDELPKIYEAFHNDQEARTCPSCSALHPGKGRPPEGWVTL